MVVVVLFVNALHPDAFAYAFAIRLPIFVATRSFRRHYGVTLSSFGVALREHTSNLVAAIVVRHADSVDLGDHFLVERHICASRFTVP